MRGNRGTLAIMAFARGKSKVIESSYLLIRKGPAGRGVPPADCGTNDIKICMGIDQILSNFRPKPLSNPTSLVRGFLTPCRVPRLWRGFFCGAGIRRGSDGQQVVLLGPEEPSVVFTL